MITRPKLEPVPGLAEARHLAKFGDLKTLEGFDLRPEDVICAEILENSERTRRDFPMKTKSQPDTRTNAEIVAALKAYQISPEAKEYARDRETARLVLLKAISHRREAPARARRAKVKAKATAKRRAKEQAAERWIQRDKAFAARNPGLHSFLDRHGLRGTRG